MKTLFKSTLFIGIISLFVACGGGVEGDKATTGDAASTKPAVKGVSYKVSTADSKVEWVGSKKFVGDKHTGFIPVKEGEVMVSNGAITGGKFVFDMNSITVTDLEGEYKGYLEAHLKGTAEGKEVDFFDVTKFPTAAFEITDVKALAGDATANHSITGNLTLKDITKSISFKANVKADGDKVTATTPQFVIDRTEWGITYGASDEASVADDMKDKIISKDMGVKITLSASK